MLNSEASMNSFTGNSHGIETLENSRQTTGVNQPVASKWPFTPAASFPCSKTSQSGRYSGGGNHAENSKSKGQLTRAGMITDVFLVVVWGATIPGFMWLGTLGGF